MNDKYTINYRLWPIGSWTDAYLYVVESNLNGLPCASFYTKEEAEEWIKSHDS